eukprot:m.8365 g.8365  ORF g.8365 m.8365 type:complete len:919 (-) comp3207_c0_seq1:263-3019(-)
MSARNNKRVRADESDYASSSAANSPSDADAVMESERSASVERAFGKVRAVFNDLCAQLNMDSETKASAWPVYVEHIEFLAQESQLDDDMLKSWAAAHLYAAARPSSLLKGCTNGVTVTQLLKATSCPMTQFLKRMDMLVAFAPQGHGSPNSGGTTLELRVFELKRKYCLLVALYAKYEKLFSTFFQRADDLRAAGDTLAANAVVKVHVYVWLVFVVMYNTGQLAGKLDKLDPTQALQTMSHALRCALSYALMHSPRGILKPKMAPLICNNRCFALDDQWDAVRKLCQAVSVTVPQNRRASELGVVFEDCWWPFERDHGRGKLWSFSVAGMPQTTYLHRKYEEVYNTHCDFDERLWQSEMTVAEQDIQAQSSVVQRARQAEQPDSTPVGLALKSADTLHDVLATAGDGPSPRCLSLLDQCSATHCLGPMQTFIKDASARFSAQYSLTLDNPVEALVARRCKHAQRLFYRVLEALTLRETERLPRVDLSVMLSNPNFHQSLFACCLEIIMFSYALRWKQLSASSSEQAQAPAFPWILEVLDIEAYEFCKVIESVVRCEDLLSSNVTKHLNVIEQRIMCELAWQRNSSIWRHLGPAGAAPTCAQTFPTGAPHQGQFASQLYASPMVPRARSRLHADDIYQAQPPRASGVTRSRSATLFCRKVYSVAFSHLERVCTALEVHPQTMLYIWTCFEHAMTQHTVLLKGRHIDHLLLCSIYAISKIASSEEQQEIPFKTIVSKYAALPGNSKQICRSVLLRAAVGGASDGGEEQRGSIIRFYNEHFMPIMKPFLFKCSPTVPTEEQPKLAFFPPSPTQREKREQIEVAPGSNVYLSPLKHPRVAALSPFFQARSGLSPRVRAQYSFCGSPRAGQRSQLDGINSVVNQERKRLQFDQYVVIDDAPPAADVARKSLHREKLKRRRLEP